MLPIDALRMRSAANIEVVTGAPAWRGQTVVNGTTLPASIDVAYPTISGGIQADDIAILWLSANRAEGSYTATASGFTEAASVTDGTSGKWQTVFWKRMSGGETGNATITPSLSSASTTSEYVAALIIYRGCKNTGNPYETTGSNLNGTSCGAMAVPIRNIASPDRTLLHFYSGYNTAAVVPTITPASGYTQRISQAGGTHYKAAVHEQAMTVPGYRGEHVTLSALVDNSWTSVYLSLVPQTTVSSTTPSLTDSSIASVVLLSSYDGTDIALRGINEVNATATARVIGTTAETDTAQSKFGGASLRVNAGCFTNPDSASWAFGSGAFTVECWVRFNAVGSTTTRYFLAQYDTNSQRSWAFLLDSDDAIKLFLSSTGGAGATVKANAAWAPSTGVWYHVAADWDGTNYRTYVDGVMKGKTATGVTLFDSTAPLSVGAALSTGAVNGNFDGWIDEVRVTKGVARYASDSGFTAPTAAFPRS